MVKAFCEFDGNLLPLLGKTEWHVPNIIRLIFYLVGLFWTFLAIGIISDVFMTGIEKVTTAKRRRKDPVTGKMRTYYIWNATVANLTLMALGSSAPEILLSLIEITTEDMFLGELGAGTIVGSAAFNLLIISAACVMAIPDGEVRFIQQTKVYYVTSTFSVFAYMWLMFILMGPSPNVTESWEAIVTLLFCPLFVGLAYLADRGYFDKKDKYKEHDDRPQHTIPDDVTDEELADIEKEIRDRHEGGSRLTAAQVAEIMRVEYFHSKSRAYYRHAAMQQQIHRRHGRLDHDINLEQVLQSVITSDEVEEEKKERCSEISFASDRYAVPENCGNAKITVIRTGCENVKATVKFVTREGTAKPELDYEHTEGVVEFEPGDTKKDIQIRIVDDDAFEENEEFYIDLMSPSVEDTGSCRARLGETKTVTVVVIDDDFPGKIRYEREDMTVIDTGKEQMITINVERFDGVRGSIAASYFTEDHTAKAGRHYEGSKGRISFDNDQLTASIPITIKPFPESEIGSKELHVILTEPEGTEFDGTTDGGEEKCICTILIRREHERAKSGLASMRDRVMSANNTMGHRAWGAQFTSAIFDVIDEEEEEGEGDEEATPTKMDYFMHVVAMPWKVLFAFVPPPDYCGGWACFCGALAMIAVVTAIVGDLANLVGCCLGIKSEITAITFVALGTSLPDTFASMTAAQLDPYADASIGNVTGSNAVNVFMGIGLAWSLAAIYWDCTSPTDAWYKKLLKLDSDVQKDIRDAAGCSLRPLSSDWTLAKRLADPREGWVCKNAVFITPAGSIWFNLMVFCLNALVAIITLHVRRERFGGELGGPKKGFLGQEMSGRILIGQWFIYVIASSAYAIAAGKKENKDWSLFFFGTG